MKLFNVRKSKNVTCEVYKKGKKVGYLTSKQEEAGNDILLDNLGYEIIAI